MKSFQSWTSRAIVVSVCGVWVSFFFSFYSNIHCQLGTVEVAPLQLPFSCPDANMTIESYSRIITQLLVGVTSISAANFLYRRGQRFEFWASMSLLMLALIFMPLQALLFNANGVDTGLHLALYRLSGSYVIMTDDYFQPALTTNEQFALTVLSTVSGILVGPVLDRAWREWKQLRVNP